jgi:hypothetical protein
MEIQKRNSEHPTYAGRSPLQQEPNHRKEHPADAKRPDSLTLLTIGHSKRSLDEFVSMLRAHGIEQVVDVRRFPGSRRVPQFNRDSLAESLRTQGFAYAHLPSVGGMRKPSPDSRNGAWRNAAFRGYADYMATEEFRSGLGKLMELARAKRTAIMCAEAVPWRCHRSLISDALIARGFEVEDILSEKARSKHELTPFAKISGHDITYPLKPGAMRRLSVTSKLPLGSSNRQHDSKVKRRVANRRKQSKKVSPGSSQQNIPWVDEKRKR